MSDNYRVNLFKKKLRESFGAPWIRFNLSKGKTHLCLTRYHLGEHNLSVAIKILKRERIDFIVTRDQFGLHIIFGDPKKLAPIDIISIPIDQAALPERKSRWSK